MKDHSIVASSVNLMVDFNNFIGPDASAEARKRED
jgi:hypothetical protein